MRPFQENQPLCKFSTFGIGGPAKYFAEVFSIEDLQELLLYCNQNNIRYHILGKGSNSLFDDQGFDGLVILNKITFLTMEDRFITVGAGYSFSLLGSKTVKKGFIGLEFAVGIPASVGGAIFMNAGANQYETCDFLNKVLFVDENGTLHYFFKEEMVFSYRFSSFQKMKGAIAAATFVLQKGETPNCKRQEIIAYRTKTQPYKDKSCGCVFRNPKGESAGALIEKCGFKGKRIGDAEVSTIHANFIINKKNACAKDVLQLAKEIQEYVKQKTGIELTMELRFVPFK